MNNLINETSKDTRYDILFSNKSREAHSSTTVKSSAPDYMYELNKRIKKDDEVVDVNEGYKSTITSSAPGYEDYTITNWENFDENVD